MKDFLWNIVPFCWEHVLMLIFGRDELGVDMEFLFRSLRISITRGAGN